MRAGAHRKRETGVTRQGSHGGRAARAAHAVAELALLIVRSVLWVGFTTAGVALNMWGAALLLLLITPDSLWGYIALTIGAALAGCIGGAVMGMGQVLALRRWLDGVASLASFLSTVLASSAALAMGTGAGWWVHTLAGELPGALAGLMLYGVVFGLLQRPMVDYMADRSLLWVPVNAAASVLGAIAMLAAYDVSGGRRDTLQFRYVGIVYAILTGVAFLWMTRRTRRAMAAERHGSTYVSDQHSLAAPSVPLGATGAGYVTDYDPEVLEIHEHRVYRVQRVPKGVNTGDDGQAGSSDRVSRHDASDPCDRPEPEIIDATYRVLS